MTMVICHRGDSGRCPENTKLAFCQAVQSGAEGIELDVHLTRDGHVVVIHDERVDRTTNGKGYVKDMTLAQLRRLQITGKGEATKHPHPGRVLCHCRPGGNPNQH